MQHRRRPRKFSSARDEERMQKLREIRGLISPEKASTNAVADDEKFVPRPDFEKMPTTPVRSQADEPLFPPRHFPPLPQGSPELGAPGSETVPR